MRNHGVHEDVEEALVGDQFDFEMYTKTATIKHKLDII